VLGISSCPVGLVASRMAMANALNALSALKSIDSIKHNTYDGHCLPEGSRHAMLFQRFAQKIGADEVSFHRIDLRSSLSSSPDQ